MAGRQPYSHQGTGGDQQRIAHSSLSICDDLRNDAATPGLHRYDNVRVGSA
jgi:hypothetical protein